MLGQQILRLFCRNTWPLAVQIAILINFVGETVIVPRLEFRHQMSMEKVAGSRVTFRSRTYEAFILAPGHVGHGFWNLLITRS